MRPVYTEPAFLKMCSHPNLVRLIKSVVHLSLPLKKHPWSMVSSQKKEEHIGLWMSPVNKPLTIT